MYSNSNIFACKYWYLVKRLISNRVNKANLVHNFY